MVTAVDNGMMAQSLMDTGQVRLHIRDDGFCLASEQEEHLLAGVRHGDKPARVTHMIADWFRRTTARRPCSTSLPMKKRYAEAVHNIEVLRELLREIDNGFVIQAKQLYHDREEITVHAIQQVLVSCCRPRPDRRSGKPVRLARRNRTITTIVMARAMAKTGRGNPSGFVP